MNQRWSQQGIALALILLIPMSIMLAETKGAMLQCNRALVNGMAVSGSAVVFRGDSVQTGSSNATITAPRTSIIVGSDSTLKYQGSSVEVNHGRVLVKTSDKMGTTFHRLKITPVNGTARFLVADTAGTPAMVAALDGALAISDGQHQMVLASGKMMSALDDTQRKDGTGVPLPEKAAGGIPGWVIAVITAGAVGGVVGGLAATGVIGGSNPVSPSR